MLMKFEDKKYIVLYQKYDSNSITDVTRDVDEAIGDIIREKSEQFQGTIKVTVEYEDK